MGDSTDRDGRPGRSPCGPRPQGGPRRAARGLAASAIAHLGLLLVLSLAGVGLDLASRAIGEDAGEAVAVVLVPGRTAPLVERTKGERPPTRPPALIAARTKARAALPGARAPVPLSAEPRAEPGVTDPTGERAPRGSGPWGDGGAVVPPSPLGAAAEAVLGPEARDPGRVASERLDGKLRSDLPGLPDDRPPPPELRPDGEGDLVYGDKGMAEHLLDVTLGKILDALQGEGGYDEKQLWGSYDPYPSRSPIKATIRPDGDVDFELNWGLDFPGVGPPPLRGPAETCPAWACREAEEIGQYGQLTLYPLQDFNDLAIMAAGGDPHAARKRRFLRQTEELRDRLADEDREARLASTEGEVRRTLAGLWSDASLTMPTKRRLLFELWDECVEPEPGAAPTAESVAGGRARRLILQFVRDHLPEGSEEGYAEGELARLNARRTSREPFAPYRPP